MRCGILCQGRFPASLIYCAHCEPIARCPVDSLCRFPIVIFQQAAQSFPAPNCSLFPSCLGLKRKQYAISLPLMVPLFMVQVDNQTPIVMNREKSVTLGILGTLARWRSTKLLPGMG